MHGALCTRFVSSSHACKVAKQAYSWNRDIDSIPDVVVLGYRVAMASAQEVEMLRSQFDDLTAPMTEMIQQ